ncbi:MAG: formylglycine-generating enzyme family protein [Proteobacteria bacterium]|nr:formylglycine-generating enzyme family protein [Pseudomonadota bacterium]MBU1717244.1 formylglycine-generating enzyme family protein [Pseudomonadota bacterium]
MPSLVTIQGIDEAITNLALGEDTLKSRLVTEIRAYFKSDDDLQEITSIAAEELATTLWNVTSPAEIKIKRKNLSSLKSSVNKTLKKLTKEGNNPEGIIIGRDNTFIVSEEHKDDLIQQLGITPGSIKSMRDIISYVRDLLNEGTKNEGEKEIFALFNELEETKKIIREKYRLGDEFKPENSEEKSAAESDGTYPEREAAEQNDIKLDAEEKEILPADVIEEVILTEEEEITEGLEPEEILEDFEEIELEPEEQIVYAEEEVAELGTTEIIESPEQGLQEKEIAADGFTAPEKWLEDAGPDMGTDEEELTAAEPEAEVEEVELAKDEELVVVRRSAPEEEPGETGEFSAETGPGEVAPDSAGALAAADFGETEAENLAETIEAELEEIEIEEQIETEEILEDFEEVEIEPDQEICAGEDDLATDEELDKLEEIIELEPEEILAEESIEEIETESLAAKEQEDEVEEVELADDEELVVVRRSAPEEEPGETGEFSAETGPGEVAPDSAGALAAEDFGETEAENLAETIEAELEEIEIEEQIETEEILEDFEEVEIDPDQEIFTTEDNLAAIEELDELEEIVELEPEEILAEETLEEIETESLAEEEPEEEIEEVELADDEELVVVRRSDPATKEDETGKFTPESLAADNHAPTDKEEKSPPDLPRLKVLSEYIDAEEALQDEGQVLAETNEEYIAQIMRRFTPKFIRIPAGSYMVGSNHPKSYEQKEHQVTLKSFHIGQVPVTNDLFELFVRDTGYETDAEKTGYGLVHEGQCVRATDPDTGQQTLTINRSTIIQRISGANWRFPNGPEKGSLANKHNHPVVQVSRRDAMAFAAWAGKRLPTEDEWEAAARGQDGRLFPRGNRWQDKLGNFSASCNGDTTPVERYGRNSASPFAIYDMLGNVYEWTATTFDSPAMAKGLAAPPSYLLKGGCWTSSGMIAACHRLIEHETWSNAIGFRCAV